MRFITGLIMSLALVVSASAANIDVYVIAGQSNAGGGAWPPTPPAQLQNQDVLYYPNLITNQVWEANTSMPLQTLWNLWPSYMGASYGSEMSFAKQVSQFTDNKVAIVKVAANGTGLETRWKPSLNDLYSWMKTRVDVAMTDMSVVDTPVIKGFVWIQGENDAGWDFWANKYQANLTDLISAVRTDFGNHDLPVLINKLHKDSNPVAKQIVRDAQDAVDSIDNVYVSNIDDLALTTDELHYTPETHIESGYRLANFLYPSGDFNHDTEVNSNDLAVFNNQFGRLGGQDFLVWQRQFQSSLTLTSIPEPSCFILMVCGLVLVKRYD